MRIIHTADIHLDSKLESHLGPEKATARRSEILETFMAMIDYAANNQVDAILISGDLFDKKRISATARNRVMGGIINNPDIDFYYLQGNHDMNSFLEDVDNIPSNLHVFSDKWTSYVTGLQKSVNIVGLEIDSSNNSILYDSLFLPFDKFNIVMLHGQQSQYSAKDKTEVINLSALKNKNIDYLALGHIHSYKEEKMDGRCTMVYPGCLDPRGFDEAGDHGFVLLDIDESDKTYSRRFISFASRRVHEIPVDVTGLTDTFEAIKKVEEVLTESEVRSKDLVKIILTGSVDVESEIDQNAILKRFENLFWVVRVENRAESRIDYESFLLDKSLKGAFVREVMSHEELTEVERARIISYGLAAIRNEGVDLCD